MVELILVMVLLATVLAFAAPSLSHFFRQRTLDEEANRLLTVTQFAQSEALSLGIPLTLWIDPVRHEYGLEPLAGFSRRGSKYLRYELHKEVEILFDAYGAPAGGLMQIEFWPDGTLGEASVQEIVLQDRRHERLYLIRELYGPGYEVLKEDAYAMRQRSYGARR